MTGAGEIIDVDLSKALDELKTISDGAVTFWDTSLTKYYENIINQASKFYKFEIYLNIPIKDYSTDQRNFLLYGITHPDFIKKFKNIKAPKKVSEGLFDGIIPNLLNQYKNNPLKIPNNIQKCILNKQCTSCFGTKIGAVARSVIIGKENIVDVSNFNLYELLEWIEKINLVLEEDEKKICLAFAGALKERISNLIEVGLSYLTLSRKLPTLSAGEQQRLKLANVLGCELTGILYVLDEPTTGLHPSDTEKLLKTLQLIKEAGNTVLVIEHDPEIIEKADYILELGPGGGSTGGNILFSGSVPEILLSEKSIINKYLNKKIDVKSDNIIDSNNSLRICGASENNLKNIDVRVPIQKLVVLTGPSGSGKSTFLFGILDKLARQYFNNSNEIPGKYNFVEGLDYFERIITIDQKTIGNSKSIRSNVATYTKLFDLIRDLFASLPEAISLGFKADKFSFNSSDERCENCNGAGVIDIDMAFMPTIETKCQACDGLRFSEKILKIKFQGHNISSILNMTVSDAVLFFNQNKKISLILNLIKELNLGYLRLGQSISSLSGGEAQRIKLCSELSKSGIKKTLYLLDEPTTGLHPKEVDLLLTFLKKLVSKGNTVVVIEHNLNVICNSDWIIDFGPGGGNHGGNIVAQGSLDQILKNKNSVTGKYLKNINFVN